MKDPRTGLTIVSLEQLPAAVRQKILSGGKEPESPEGPRESERTDEGNEDITDAAPSIPPVATTTAGNAESPRDEQSLQDEESGAKTNRSVTFCEEDESEGKSQQETERKVSSSDDEAEIPLVYWYGEVRKVSHGGVMKKTPTVGTGTGMLKEGDAATPTGVTVVDESIGVALDSTSSSPMVLQEKAKSSALYPSTKERIVLLTKDFLLVYDTDGELKRKVKISEIASILSQPGCVDPFAHFESCCSSPASTGKHSRAEGGKQQQHDEALLGLVPLHRLGLLVPSQHDLAFELVHSYDTEELAQHLHQARRSSVDTTTMDEMDTMVLNLNNNSIVEAMNLSFSQQPQPQTASVVSPSSDVTPRRTTGSTGATLRRTPTPVSVPGAVGGASTLQADLETNIIVGEQIQLLSTAIRRARESVNQFVRALMTLARRSNSNSELPYEMRVTTLPALAPTTAITMKEMLRLKKDQPRVAPLLPPVIETISAETLRNRTDDELATEDTLEQLRKQIVNQEEENWINYNAEYLEEVARFTMQQEEVEQLRGTCKQLQAKTQCLTLQYECRRKRLEKEDADSRKELLEANGMLSKHHQAHTTTIEETRNEIEACVQRVRKLQTQQLEDNLNYVDRKKEMDYELLRLQRALGLSQKELQAKSDLPSINDLKQETQKLLEAEEIISGEIAVFDSVADEMRQSRIEIAKMQQENKVLEDAVLDKKARVSEAKKTSAELTMKISSEFAKRNRFAKSIESKDASIENMAAEIVSLSKQLEKLDAINQRLEQRCSILEVEGTVCEDLKREADIHDSITRSLAEAALAKANAAIDEEAAIQDQVDTFGAGVGYVPPLSSRRSDGEGRALYTAEGVDQILRIATPRQQSHWAARFSRQREALSSDGASAGGSVTNRSASYMCDPKSVYSSVHRSGSARTGSAPAAANTLPYPPPGAARPLFQHQ